MIAHSFIFRPLSLALLAATLTLPAMAAPTVNTYAGNTSVALSPALLNALSALHVAPSRQFPATLEGATK